MNIELTAPTKSLRPVPSLTSYDAPPQPHPTLPYAYLLYQPAWHILICAVCKDGVRCTQSAIINHLVDDHQLPKEDVAIWSKQFIATVGQANDDRVNGVWTEAGDLPLVLPHLEVVDARMCPTCGEVFRHDQISKGTAHAVKYDHGQTRRCKAQTVFGNHQLREKREIRGKVGILFPVRLETTPTVTTTTAVATTSTLPSQAETGSVLAAFTDTLNAASLPQGDSDFRNIRVSIRKLGWYSLVGQMSEQSVADLVRKPMTVITSHHVHIEPRLHRLPTIVSAAFEKLYHMAQHENVYLRLKGFEADHKHLGTLVESTRKNHANHWTRLMAFVLRVFHQPTLIPHDIVFANRAQQALTRLTAHLESQNDEDAAIDDLVDASFEVIWACEPQSLADSSKMPLSWFLPLSAKNGQSFDKASNIFPRLQGLDYCCRLVLHHRQASLFAEIANDPTNDTPNGLRVQQILQETRGYLVDAPSPYRRLEEAEQLIHTEAKGQLLLPNSDWSDDTGKTFIFQGLPLTVDDISRTAQLAVDGAFSVLTRDLLFGNEPNPLLGETMYDDFGNVDYGYSFLVDPRNGLIESRSLLIETIIHTPHLSERFQLRAVGNTTTANASACREYLLRGESFRQHLAVAIHLTCGAPSRATESTAWKIINLQTAFRDIFYSCGTMCIAGGYSKTDSINSAQSVRPKMLSSALAEILARYLALVRPLEQFLDRVLRPDHPTARYTTHLFLERCGPVPKDWLRKHLQLHFTRAEASPYGVAAYRHAYIAFGRQLLGKEYEPIEADEDDTYFDLQAGHSTLTANTIYARERSYSSRAGMSAEALLGYARISKAWVKALGLEDYSPRMIEPVVFVTEIDEATEEAAPAGPRRRTLTLTPFSGRPMTTPARVPLSAPAPRIVGGTTAKYQPPGQPQNLGVMNRDQPTWPDASHSATRKPVTPTHPLLAMTESGVEPKSKRIDTIPLSPRMTDSVLESTFRNPGQTDSFLPMTDSVSVQHVENQGPSSHLMPASVVHPLLKNQQPLLTSPHIPEPASTPSIDKRPPSPHAEKRPRKRPSLSHLPDTPLRGKTQSLEDVALLGRPPRPHSPISLSTRPLYPNALAGAATATDPFAMATTKLSLETILGAARLVSAHYEQMRPGQAQAIELLYTERKHDSMIVLPTGWGKTLVYAVQYFLPGYQGLTIIVTPTNALRDDLLRRFREYRLPVFEWTSDTPLKRGFILIGTDRVSNHSFMRWCERNRRLLTRIIIEEAHLALSAGNYRPRLRQVADLRAVTLNVPWTLVSATTPPINTGILLDLHGIDVCSIMRVGNIRPFHRFSVYPTFFRNLNQKCFDELKLLVDHLKSTWLSPNGQIIIFCGPRDTVSVTAKYLGVPGFWREQGKEQADQEADKDMSARRTRFMAGEIPVAVSTSLLSVGVDIANLEVVIHFGNPNDLGDYLQEVGRCGRTESSAARALSILLRCDSRMPTADWHQRGLDALDEFASPTVRCRRLPLSKFNDDHPVDCQSLKDAVQCDICLVNSGRPVPWLPVPHGLTRKALYVNPAPHPLLIECHLTCGETKDDYLGIEPKVPESLDLPSYPLRPSAESEVSLSDQFTSAIRVLHQRAVVGSWIQTTRTRIEQSCHRWQQRLAQSKCEGIIDPIGTSCVVCFAASLLPNARTTSTGHCENRQCPSLDATIFDKANMPAFRRQLKTAIKATGGHCTSCLVPYEPYPSRLHNEPNEARGSCAIQQSRTTQHSDSDVQHIMLYLLLTGGLKDSRPSRDLLPLDEATTILATVGLTGCLVAAEAIGWLRDLVDMR